MCVLGLASGAAGAVEDPLSAPASVSAPETTARESLAEAWWTGPLLAPNASTFPPGHALVETYVYDVITDG
ncbi:MAG: hypothetical protein ACRETG_06825, partial [Steroidobacteraceae bacterium]